MTKYYKITSFVVILDFDGFTALINYFLVDEHFRSWRESLVGWQILQSAQHVWNILQWVLRVGSLN